MMVAPAPCTQSRATRNFLAFMRSASTYSRRQDVKRFFRINGALYLWRTSFLREASSSWLSSGKHLLLDMPEQRAFSIDDELQFKVAELLLVQGLVQVPWFTAS